MHFILPCIVIKRIFIIAGPGLIVDLHGQNHKKNTTGTVKQFLPVENLSLSKTAHFYQIFVKKHKSHYLCE
jgi:hypothetical protein